MLTGTWKAPTVKLVAGPVRAHHGNVLREHRDGQPDRGRVEGQLRPEKVEEASVKTTVSAAVLLAFTLTAAIAGAQPAPFNQAA